MLSKKATHHTRTYTYANINSCSADGGQPFAERIRQEILSRSEPQGHQQAQAVAMTTALGGSPELRGRQWVGRNSDGCRRSEIAPAATVTRCQHFLRQQRSEQRIPDCFQSAEAQRAQGHRKCFACCIYSCDAGGISFEGRSYIGWLDEWVLSSGDPSL